MIAPALEVRPARRSDAAFLYPWIVERGGRLPGEKRTFGTSRAHRRWHRRALRDPEQLHFIFRHGDEPCAYLRFRRRGSAVDLWLLTTGAAAGATALEPALRDAIEQLRIHWSPTGVTVAPQGVAAVATGLLERLGFRAQETGAHVLDLAPLVEEEIREFKNRAWGTEKIVESYEKRIYRRSGVIQVKNRVEIAYACGNASGQVLDAGAGSGRFTFPLLDAGCRVTALDISAPMLAVIRQQAGPVPVLVGDLLRLPFADATFDSVVSITVVEHLPGYREAIAELARVLRPGGTLVMQFRSSEHLAMAGERGHQSGAVAWTAQLSADEMRELLARSGLAAVRIAPYDFLNTNRVAERFLGPLWKPLHRSLDLVLRLPPLAWAAAAWELRLGRFLPHFLAPSYMVVARRETSRSPIT